MRYLLRTREESVEGIGFFANTLIVRNKTVGLDAMLETVPATRVRRKRLHARSRYVQFPARVTSLDTSLTNVDRDDFSAFAHFAMVEKQWKGSGEDANLKYVSCKAKLRCC
jgi:hypothetical protein